RPRQQHGVPAHDYLGTVFAVELRILRLGVYLHRLAPAEALVAGTGDIDVHVLDKGHPQLAVVTEDRAGGTAAVHADDIAILRAQAVTALRLCSHAGTAAQQG